MEAERFTGVVVNFHWKRQFGFIADHFDPIARHGRYFFHIDSVEPDVIGSRCLADGTTVSFELTIKDGRERAIAIRNENPALGDIDPSTYVEQGEVFDWNGDIGHVVRPSGDHLVFLAKNILSEGIETIRPGTQLQYGIV